MPDSGTVSRRTIATTGLWATPILVTAIAAPLAAASTVRADLGLASAFFQNASADDFSGGFEAVVTGSASSEPTTEITAYIQLDPVDGATFSDFRTELIDGWTLVQALGDGAAGTIILRWQGAPGLSPGGTESAGYVGFGYTLTGGPRTTSYTVTLTSSTADSATRTVDAVSV